MKLDGTLVKMFLSLVPAFLLFVNIPDLIDVLNDKRGYPFGSEFFSPNSIYHSRAFYIGFAIVSILSSIITLILIWKQKWSWLLLFLFIDIALFFYPIITMED